MSNSDLCYTKCFSLRTSYESKSQSWNLTLHLCINTICCFTGSWLTTSRTVELITVTSMPVHAPRLAPLRLY